jgi:ubiquinone/menaquinone biosynthesis C-methylase UbiE
MTVLDVGAGSGDIARLLIRRARRRGVELTVLALDTHREAAALARADGVLPVLATAAALPLPARAVDVVLASQFLHHFTRPSAIVLARAFDRLARVGVVLCEPRRTPTAAAGIWLASHLLRFHRVTRLDGVLSVRRSFTRPELTRLLLAAGVRGTVSRRPGFRLVAWWRSDRADA